MCLLGDFLVLPFPAEPGLLFLLPTDLGGLFDVVDLRLGVLFVDAEPGD